MDIGKSISWTDVKYARNVTVHCYDVTNTNVIVNNNTCGELVGGKFVTTSVKCLQDCLFACVLWQG